jgi:D-sedoheptulose 7-phosphate isomerase
VTDVDTTRTPAAIALVRRTLADAVDLHETVAEGDLTPVTAAAEAMVRALRDGGRILVFGNGGSAADAQHVAAELVGRFQRERRALAALALTTDTSVLTSLSNDYAYDQVFARQIEALGRRGDIAFGISTSGRSPNVVVAFDVARSMGLTTVALTGRDGGPVGHGADIHMNVPSDSTARAQEVHRTLLHALCDLVESAFA